MFEMGALTVFSFLMCLHSLLCFPDLFNLEEGGADNEGIDKKMEFRKIPDRAYSIIISS